MAKRLFLHIGAMKSGTSYLQALCTENRDRLEQAGVRWVRASEEERSAAMDRFLRSGEVDPKAKLITRRMRRTSRGWDGDLFLSMELLGPRGPGFQQRLVAAAGADEVHLIVSARDLARVIPSRWQTTTRNGGTWTWPEYVRSVCVDDAEENPAAHGFWRQQDVAQMLRSWSTVTEPRGMHLVTVPASSSDRGILWRRFAQVLGIDPEGYREPDDVWANTSLSATAAEVMRRVNTRVDDLELPHYRQAFKSGLATMVYGGLEHNEPRLQIPASYRPWVEQRSRRMIDELQELEVEVVGDLYELLPGRPDPAAVDSAEVSDAELLETAVDGLAGLGRLTGTTRLEYRALQHRYAVLEREQAKIAEDRTRLARENAELRKQRDLARRRLREAGSKPSIAQRTRRIARRSRVARWCVRRLRTVRSRIDQPR
ncbi:MAG: hypothetical protein GEU93_19735 [Propionibacteriales bacterium]|nr:hypothetical protein [Propionibacteriales bacterium]